MAITGGSIEPHFDPQEFDAFLEAHGTEAIWRKGTQCPCVDERTGHSRTDCPFCEIGMGMLWDDGTPLIVLAPGRARNDNYDATGLWLSGMVTLTFPSTVTPGHLDIIEMMNAEMVVNIERHVRDAQDKLGRSKERLRFRQVIVAEQAVAIQGAALYTFTSPDDFVVQPDASIVWTDAMHGPAPGVQYAMRYRAHPSYVVISPQSRDENTTKMPYRAIAQRLDFFSRAAVGQETPL